MFLSDICCIQRWSTLREEHTRASRALEQGAFIFADMSLFPEPQVLLLLMMIMYQMDFLSSV